VAKIYPIRKSVAKPRTFPTSHHQKGFKDYYSKARIYVELDGKRITDPNLIRETQAIVRGLAVLGLAASETKVVWSSKKEGFIVQSDIVSRDVVVTIDLVETKEEVNA
jgi:hypothetical protein